MVRRARRDERTGLSRLSPEGAQASGRTRSFEADVRGGGVHGLGRSIRSSPEEAVVWPIATVEPLGRSGADRLIPKAVAHPRINLQVLPDSRGSSSMVWAAQAGPLLNASGRRPPSAQCPWRRAASPRRYGRRLPAARVRSPYRTGRRVSPALRDNREPCGPRPCW